MIPVVTGIVAYTAVVLVIGVRKQEIFRLVKKRPLPCLEVCDYGINVYMYLFYYLIAGSSVRVATAFSAVRGMQGHLQEDGKKST